MMMSGLTIAMPRRWGKERDPMTLRLVTPDNQPDLIGPVDGKAPGVGLVIGVFCGSMFWIGLGIGWALWG